MLYHFDRNICVYTPPKCGSTSLHKKYCAEGWIYVMGPQFNDTHAEKHTYCVPFPMISRGDGKAIMLVRNPYMRAVSLWSHYKQWWVAEIGFRDFLDRIVEPGTFNFLSASLCDFWDHCQVEPTEVWKLEDISDNLPRENVSVLRGDVWNEYTLDFVADWFCNDFERFNYDVDYSPHTHVDN